MYSASTSCSRSLHHFRFADIQLGFSMGVRILNTTAVAQKMKFSIKDFLSKCDQICSLLQIWSHLLKKSLMENFIICALSK